VSIIGLMLKGATPTIPLMLRAFSMTARYSRKSVEYLRTRTWALTPSTFSRNTAWNPPVTLMAVASAETPRITPATAKNVLTEMLARLREAR
jgi:hypothetical protein